MKKYTKSNNIIIEGQGFDSFQIDKATAEEVKDKLGDNFEEIRHGDYSVELYYEDLGVSTMEDVIARYGEPKWSTCKDCDTWTSEYEGIQFIIASKAGST